MSKRYLLKLPAASCRESSILKVIFHANRSLTPQQDFGELSRVATGNALAPGFIALFLSALLLSGCSLPKIIVLHDPLSADEHVRLGGIYDAQGKTELARGQYQAAVKQNKKHIRAWTLLGDSAYQLKEYGEAEKAYGRALDLDRSNGDLHNNLAWVYVQQDRKLSKAQDLVMQALELTPDHRPYYLDTLGVVLLKLGKAQEAVAALKESVDTIPRDQPDLLAEAYQHLADAYRAAGDILSADSALERQRRLKPAPPKEPVLQP